MGGLSIYIYMLDARGMAKATPLARNSSDRRSAADRKSHTRNTGCKLMKTLLTLAEHEKDLQNQGKLGKLGQTMKNH